MSTPLGGPSAENEYIKSSVGYIVNIIENGCGFICSLDGKEDNVFAPEIELFNQGYSASIGDIVCFHKMNSGTGQPKAANIQWMGWEKPQERADLLFAVARLGNPRNWLSSLANLAEEESWSSRPEKPHQKDILMSYIQHTFVRLCEMNDAVSFFDLNETRYMAFNTGLSSRFHLRDGRLINIYAIFAYRPNNGCYQAWELTEFMPSDECRRKYGIRPDLPVADYGQYNLTLFNPTNKDRSRVSRDLIQLL
ncbi:DUF3825 domain-containing protein, partial [Cyanobium sp. FGCU-52]|nr:DUF3825 domain-containing protein [Cyanobium sp. FGCU52]